MDLQNIKRWQWAVAGLLIGLALSFLWSNLSLAHAITGSRENLQRDLMRTIGANKVPAIKNIKLSPPLEGGYEVTYDEFVPIGGRFSEKGKYEAKYLAYGNKKFPVQYSWNTIYGNDRNQENWAPDLKTYLDAVAAKHPDFHYTYLWWHQPKWTYAIWTGGCVLLIGGVWPSVVVLLTGGRPQKKAEESGYDMNRFQTGAEPQPVLAVAGNDQAARLDELNSELERSLAGNAISSGSVEDVAAENATVIRKLDAGPLVDNSAPKKTAEEEAADFKGEFYPVARAPKKNDE